MDEDAPWFLDLLVVALATAGCGVAVAAGVGGVPRLVLAAPLVLFLPGYALVSALFPEHAATAPALEPFDEVSGSSLGVDARLRDTAELGTAGRVSLSVLGSLAVVALVALGSDLVGFEVRLRPVLVGIVATTALALVVAAVARLRRDPADRYALPARLPLMWFTAERGHQSRDATVPNLVLVVGLLALSASVGYAAVASPQDDGFTEFYAQTDNMTADTQSLYDATYTGGQESSFTTYVENHEGSNTGYMVVAELQRVDRDGDGTGRVTESQRLATRETSVAANTTKRVTVSFTPNMTGDLRLVTYLYRGESVPENPSPASAYRTLRFNVTVSS